MNIKKFLSYSPIFNIGKDKEFGSYSEGKSSGETVRCSLFMIPMGMKKYYLFTFRCDSSLRLSDCIMDLELFDIKFYKILKFDEADGHKNNMKKIGEEYDQLKQKLKDDDADYTLEHREALLNYYKLSIESTKEMKSVVFNKVLAYIALVAFMTPIYLDVWVEADYRLKLIETIFVFILLIIVVNLFLFTFNFLKVDTVHSYDEENLTESKKAIDNHLLMYFYISKRESEYRRRKVSIVKNIEINFVIYLVVFLIWSLKNILS